MVGRAALYVIVLCGKPEDVNELLNERKIDPDIVIILIDILQQTYYTNKTSMDYMKQVLVVTVPPPDRHYEDFNITGIPSDYVRGYVDAVFLFGYHLKNEYNSGKTVDFTSNFNYTTIQESWGTLHFDTNGDIEENISIIYTTADTLEYKLLLQCDTSTGTIIINDPRPSFIWKNGLPSDVPKEGLSVLIIVIIALSVLVVLVLLILLTVFSLYRIEHANRLKKWSHIAPEKIVMVNNSDISRVSLKIEEDLRKNSFTERPKIARYDEKLSLEF
ncbi:heat-stable enterotoxin receptor-like [Protopterus annectens]|uniref:heat-stable enterotoxin receptor-like n=1 Tax=Protopterus annectens TaxID=7888 RepID=UPI001CF949A4|nr:heat-stable enterotoxin receptor-like [Protopterus annectens]